MSPAPEDFRIHHLAREGFEGIRLAQVMFDPESRGAWKQTYGRHLVDDAPTVDATLTSDLPGRSEVIFAPLSGDLYIQGHDGGEPIYQLLLETKSWMPDTVKLSNIQVHPRFRNQGIGTKLTRNAVKVAAAGGALLFKSNVSRGGSVLAGLIGLSPTQKDWNDFREGPLAQKLAALACDEDLTPDQQNIVIKILCDPDPGCLNELANLTQPVNGQETDGAGVPLGRYLLQGLSWEAELDVTDPLAWGRFNNRVNKKLGPWSQDEYLPLPESTIARQVSIRPKASPQGKAVTGIANRYVHQPNSPGGHR